MTTFEVYIDDDRYRIKTLFFIAAANEAEAIEEAQALLRESDYHKGVELRLGEKRVFAARKTDRTGRHL